MKKNRITSYREMKSKDSVKEWEVECLEYTQNQYDFLPLSEAYEHYHNWCLEQGYVAFELRKFCSELWEIGHRSSTRRVWPDMEQARGIEYVQLKGVIEEADSVTPQIIDRWVEQHFEATYDRQDVVPKAEVYKKFLNHCKAQEIDPISRHVLTSYLKGEWNIPEKVTRVNGKPTRCWCAVRFSPDPLSQGGVDSEAGGIEDKEG